MWCVVCESSNERSAMPNVSCRNSKDVLARRKIAMQRAMTASMDQVKGQSGGCTYRINQSCMVQYPSLTSHLPVHVFVSFVCERARCETSTAQEMRFGRSPDFRQKKWHTRSTRWLLAKNLSGKGCRVRCRNKTPQYRYPK